MPPPTDQSPALLPDYVGSLALSTAPTVLSTSLTLGDCANLPRASSAHSDQPFATPRAPRPRDDGESSSQPDPRVSLQALGHTPPPGFTLETHDEELLRDTECILGNEAHQAQLESRFSTVRQRVQEMFHAYERHAEKWPNTKADRYAAQYPMLHAVDNLFMWA